MDYKIYEAHYLCFTNEEAVHKQKMWFSKVASKLTWCKLDHCWPSGPLLFTLDCTYSRIHFWEIYTLPLESRQSSPLILILETLVWDLQRKQTNKQNNMGRGKHTLKIKNVDSNILFLDYSGVISLYVCFLVF